mmetsp:Transcript_3653/g.4046  ORF Transcript_3653/g.4046 Transcript_3653/m.4046 type:complete len:136 (-) Transcript_3653:68-475(-)
MGLLFSKPIDIAHELMYLTDGGQGAVYAIYNQENPLPDFVHAFVKQGVNTTSFRTASYDATTAIDGWEKKCRMYGIPEKLSLPIIVFCGTGRFCAPIDNLQGTDVTEERFKSDLNKHYENLRKDIKVTLSKWFDV